MSVKIVTGNVLKAKENIVAQQTNCMGAMGAGIARQIRKKYPKVYLEYKEFCSQHNSFPPDLLGKCQVVEVDKGKYVANLFGQYDCGKRGIKWTNYVSLSKALRKLEKFAREHGLSVAIPHGIGCRLAGGSWDVVSKMIYEVFESSEVSAVIYRYNI